MATTMKLIGSQTLGSSTSSVSFSSIPATFTDLLLIGSARSDRASNVVDDVYFQFNSDAGSNMTSRTLTGNGATASSSSTSAAQKLAASSLATAATATASTFASWEMYVPNYAGSTNKSFSITNGHETNATTAYITAIAGLWSQTAAITTIAISPVNGTNFVSGSSFFLYGITKA